MEEEVNVKGVNDASIGKIINECESEWSEVNYDEVINDLKDQVETEHNNYLRALADADNIRKNFAKKQSDLYMYQYESIMKELLDILDDTDRGMASNEFSEGGKLILSKLSTKLNKFGLEKFIPVNGDLFDSNIMEAISVIPVEGMEGKVIDCTLVGYKYNGKMIRYPKVVVGTES